MKLLTNRKYKNLIEERKAFKEKIDELKRVQEMLESDLREMKAMMEDSYSGKTGIAGDEAFYQLLGESSPESKVQIEDERLQEAVKWAQSKGYVTVYTNLVDRQQPDEFREYAQTIAYVRAFEDPIVAAIPDAYQTYVIGRGVKVRCGNAKIQKVIDDFRARNNLALFEKRMVWLLEVESEFFIVYYIDDRTGLITIRDFEPPEIKKIETKIGDKDTILSYKREVTDGAGGIKYLVYPDVDYFEQKDLNDITTISKYDPDHPDNVGKTAEELGWQGERKLIQFIKLGKNREVRSRVVLEKVLRWIEIYKNFIMDRVILNHERSRVVWILEISSTLSDAWKRYRMAPKGGTIKISTPDRKWSVVNAKINADDVKEDALSILYQITAGSGIPLNILLQRVSEQVYASLKKSDTPFIMRIVDRQDFLREHYRKMFRVVIRESVNRSKLPKKVTIRKVAESYISSFFNEQFNRYVEGTISEKELLSIINRLIHRSFKEFTKSDWMSNDLEAREKITKIYEDFIQDSYNALMSITESEKGSSVDNELLKHIIEKAYNIFEQGTKVSVSSEDVPLEIIFPEIVKEDNLESAKILKIHRELGIVSKSTASTLAGYNPEEEMAKISLENKRDGDV